MGMEEAEHSHARMPLSVCYTKHYKAQLTSALGLASDSRRTPLTFIPPVEEELQMNFKKAG